ncbi:hypothetical protein AB3X31_22030 [Raoultella terrigena]|uniref:hypothetical protein n=1 Tax=Raoultella terrigena TaxID=577 RepID=UPI00349FBA1B
MTGTINAGSIFYEVDMDTSRLLAARREVDAALNGLSGNMGRLEASVSRYEVVFNVTVLTDCMMRVWFDARTALLNKSDFG